MDQEWLERTDNRLASLTSSEIVQNDRLDELEERLEEIDRILRGDPQRDTGGIVEHLHEVQTGLNALRAIMAPDALGGGGILNRLKALEKKDASEDRRSEYRSRFWIAVVGFVSAFMVALITNLDRLEALWMRQVKATGDIEQMMVKAKTPKARRRRVRQEVRQESHGSAKETVQEGRNGDAPDNQ